ncbi:hypothetical protein PENSTE_c046G02807 [Penicillium steckii]|uniref:Uncharacterized protein n=1 Tax=Penicillium steckii TaxID=303698 RepID=A0A1V6SIH2_9EURO|nr:hypothetical protein PENSTE_c046G02807 [Penicillium steckii]
MKTTDAHSMSSNFSLGAYGYSGQNLTHADSCQSLNIPNYFLNDYNSSGIPDLEQLWRNSERPSTIEDIEPDIFEHYPYLGSGPALPEITESTSGQSFDRGYCTSTGQNSYDARESSRYCTYEVCEWNFSESLTTAQAETNAGGEPNACSTNKAVPMQCLFEELWHEWNVKTARERNSWCGEEDRWSTFQ